MKIQLSTDEMNQAFLEEVALEAKLQGEYKKVFLERFARNNRGETNTILGKKMWPHHNYDQKFTESLKNAINQMKATYKEISDLIPEKLKGSKGRPSKGKSDWEIIYDWLWDEKYTEFCKTQLSDQENIQQETIILDKSIFKNMLDAERKKLTSNSLISKNGFRSNRNFDDIYVPLGLVKPKDEPKRDFKTFENDPRRGSHFYRLADYEVTEKFSNTEFFDKVLDQEKNHRLAIIGEPGAGKTTLLQKISTWIEENRPDDQIIWVPLAKVKNQSLADYLLENWLKNAKDVSETTKAEKDALIDIFKAGNVWLLLDGVDEMGINNPLFNLHEQITGCWLKYAKIILSCRLNVWEAGINHLHDFEVYRNLDFSDSERDQFIQNWFEKNPTLGEQLINELNQECKERIQDLVKNPLRLTMICFSWHKNKGKLPDTKAELYKECVDAFYDWKAKEAFPTTPTERRKLNQALGELAKNALERDSAWFRITHQQICQYLSDPNEEGLGKKAIELGWLNQVGISEENANHKIYAFFHPSFQEYFAALVIENDKFFLNHLEKNPDLGSYKIFEIQWKEVLYIWLGKKEFIEKETKNNLVKNILDFNDDCGNYYWINILFVLANGLIDFDDCDPILIDKVVLYFLNLIWENHEININKDELNSIINIDLQISLPYNEIVFVQGIRALRILKKESVLKQLNTKFKYYKKLKDLLAKYLGKSIDLTNKYYYFDSICLDICYEICKLEENKQEYIDFLLKELEFNFSIYREQNNNEEDIKLKLKCLYLSLKILEFLPKNKLIISVFNEINNKDKSDFLFFEDLFSLSQNEISDINSYCRYSLIHLNYMNTVWKTTLVATKHLDFQLDLKNVINSTTLDFLNNKSEGKLTKILDEIIYNDVLDELEISKENNHDNISKDYIDDESKNEVGIRLSIILIRGLLKIKDAQVLSYIAFLFFMEIKSATLPQPIIEILFLILLMKIQGNLMPDLKQQLKSLLFYIVMNYNLFFFALPKLVKILKKNIKNDNIKYDDLEFHFFIDEVIFYISQNLKYADFYFIWNSTGTNIAQTLNQQILDLPSQLQPTPKTYPIVINVQSLEDETDNDSIAQELCNQIYAIVFPNETDIPEINNAPQLKRLIPHIKKQLNTQNLALIFHNGEPNESLTKFCKKLTDVIHIKWITEQPIAYGVPPQENLVNILQNWIDHLV